MICRVSEVKKEMWEEARRALEKKQMSIEQFLEGKEKLRQQIESEEGLEICLRDACPACGGKVYVVIWANEQDVLIACGSGCIVKPTHIVNWADFISAIEVRCC